MLGGLEVSENARSLRLGGFVGGRLLVAIQVYPGYRNASASSGTTDRLMKLTVFGATGGVGREVVTQAIDAGHHVTAYVRNPAKLDFSHPELTVVAASSPTAPPCSAR